MADFVSKGPSPEVQPSLTDTYFRHTRTIVQEHGDVEVVCCFHAAAGDICWPACF